jgi:hypothetical protein
LKGTVPGNATLPMQRLFRVRARGHAHTLQRELYGVYTLY